VRHFVTSCDISKCHNVHFYFVTILGFCHTVRIFYVVKYDIKRRQVTNFTDPKPQGYFQTFCKYLGFEDAFRSDKTKNLDTGYVYVLGFESCSERL